MTTKEFLKRLGLAMLWAFIGSVIIALIVLDIMQSLGFRWGV